MRIAFPINEDNGAESRLHNHFGTAIRFVIADTEADTLHTIDNADLAHSHGNCQPIQAIGGQAVEAVIVGGIGKGALKKLMDAGIKVYRGVDGTVRENLELVRENRLPEFMFNMTCSGHGTGGGCTH
jgi:predicted Fe-Mo cluster-binding NifX family protein